MHGLELLRLGELVLVQPIFGELDGIGEENLLCMNMFPPNSSPFICVKEVRTEKYSKIDLTDQIH